MPDPKKIDAIKATIKKLEAQKKAVNKKIKAELAKEAIYKIII
jgi:hypothetical protein